MHIQAKKYELDFAIFLGGRGTCKNYTEVFCRFPRKNGWSWKAEGHFVAHIICTWEPSGLDGSVSISSSPKFSRKTKKNPTFVSVFCHPGAKCYGAMMGSLSLNRSSSQTFRSSPESGSTFDRGRLEVKCVETIHPLLLQLPVLHMLAPTTSTTSLTATLGESKQLNKLSLTSVVWD